MCSPIPPIFFRYYHVFGNSINIYTDAAFFYLKNDCLCLHDMRSGGDFKQSSLFTFTYMYTHTQHTYIYNI